MFCILYNPFLSDPITGTWTITIRATTTTDVCPFITTRFLCLQFFKIPSGGGAAAGKGSGIKGGLEMDVLFEVNRLNFLVVLR